MSTDIHTPSLALRRLNTDLDNLYELLYDSFPTITEADYASFGSYLSILLQNLKELQETCEESKWAECLKKETNHLCMNISALEEMDSDIRNFRIKALHDNRIKNLMNSLKAI